MSQSGPFGGISKVAGVELEATAHVSRLPAWARLERAAPLRNGRMGQAGKPMRRGRGQGRRATPPASFSSLTPSLASAEERGHASQSGPPRHTTRPPSGLPSRNRKATDDSCQAAPVAEADPDERKRLNDLIDAHPARTADHRWTSLQRVHEVMRASEIELLALVQAFEENDAFSLQVMRSDQPQNLQRFLDELIRRAHNYLSSIKMLVDHSRNLMKDYSGNPVRAEYDRRVADMVAAGRASVLQRLRNYLIHYRIPPFGIELQLVAPTRRGLSHGIPGS